MHKFAANYFHFISIYLYMFGWQVGSPCKVYSYSYRWVLLRFYYIK